jgi:hypothetical protein
VLLTTLTRRRAAAGMELFYPDDAMVEPVGWAGRLAEIIARGQSRDRT